MHREHPQHHGKIICGPMQPKHGTQPVQVVAQLMASSLQQVWARVWAWTSAAAARRSSRKNVCAIRRGRAAAAFVQPDSAARKSFSYVLSIPQVCTSRKMGIAIIRRNHISKGVGPHRDSPPGGRGGHTVRPEVPDPPTWDYCLAGAHTMDCVPLCVRFCLSAKVFGLCLSPRAPRGVCCLFMMPWCSARARLCLWRAPMPPPACARFLTQRAKRM